MYRVLAFILIDLTLKVDEVLLCFFDVQQYVFTLDATECFDLDLLLDELILKITYLLLCTCELGLQYFDLLGLDQVFGSVLRYV